MTKHTFLRVSQNKKHLEMEHTYLAGWLSRAKRIRSYTHIYNIFDGLDLFSRPIQNYTLEHPHLWAETRKKCAKELRLHKYWRILKPKESLNFNCSGRAVFELFYNAKYVIEGKTNRILPLIKQNAIFTSKCCYVLYMYASLLSFTTRTVSNLEVSS